MEHMKQIQYITTRLNTGEIDKFVLVDGDVTCPTC